MTMGYRDGASMAQAMPSQDDRIAAGIAHLGIFGGFWLVAPIIVYFWKGKTSRFVAFHAVQAGLLNVLAIPLAIVGVVVGFVAMIVVGVLGEGQGDSRALFQVLGPMSFIAAIALPNLLVVIFAALAGVRALRGREWAIPIIGRLARSVVKEP